MSKKSRFTGTAEKQQGKGAQALLKCKPQHLYHIGVSLPSQLSWKISPLLTYQVLVMLVNTLVVDEKYPVLSRYNLTIPIKIQVCQKQKTFSEFSAAFLKSTRNFKYFEKKMTLIDFVFPNLRTLKT